MKLESHIASLVKENDMVIMPSVGGIVAHNREAVFNADSGIILPPGRSYTFNPKLNYQDGLLVQSYMQASNMSQNEALLQVNLDIEEFKKSLASSESIFIKNVGTFNQNTEGYIQLIDNAQSNSSIEMFGLPKLQVEKINKVTDNVELKEKSNVSATLEIKPIIREEKVRFGKWVAAAAVVIFMFLFSKPVSDENISLDMAGTAFDFLELKHEVKAPIIADVAEKQVTKKAVVEKIELNEKAISVLPQPPETKYCIIVSSLANKYKADQKLAYYKKAGFKNASIITSNGRYRISIGNFSSKEIGIEKLNEIRAFSARYNDAWLLKARI